MIAGLALGLEQQHRRVRRQLGGEARARHARADDGDVGAVAHPAHAVEEAVDPVERREPDRIAFAQDLMRGVGIHLQLDLRQRPDRALDRVGLTSRSRVAPTIRTGVVDARERRRT